MFAVRPVTWPLLAVGLLASCVAAPQSSPAPVFLTSLQDTCSGAAVAPHVILTATHCLHARVSVNGNVVAIVRRIDDGNDHTLLVVRQSFAGHALVAQSPRIGAHIHLTSNPGDLRGLYADGTVAGADSAHHAILLNVPIFFGDSGAAVLDAQDRVVGVISGVRVLYADGVLVTWGVMLPIRFTAAQWRDVGLVGPASQ